ncbi:hypothetical protein IG631_23986 [Alternaria alternata]|nr:hypothetical protein IG631_23986 [Alternaria alternata]
MGLTSIRRPRSWYISNILEFSVANSSYLFWKMAASSLSLPGNFRVRKRFLATSSRQLKNKTSAGVPIYPRSTCRGRASAGGHTGLLLHGYSLVQVSWHTIYKHQVVATTNTILDAILENIDQYLGGNEFASLHPRCRNSVHPRVGHKSPQCISNRHMIERVLIR